MELALRLYNQSKLDRRQPPDGDGTHDSDDFNRCGVDRTHYLYHFYMHRPPSFVIRHVYLQECASLATAQRRICQASSVIKRSHLSVDVAERTSKGVHGVTLGDVGELSLKHLTKGQGVVEGTVAAGRHIQEGDGVRDGVLAVLDVLVLPDPPDAIDLTMVD